MIKNIIKISKDIFISDGRIVEVRFNRGLLGNAIEKVDGMSRILKNIEEHKCVAIKGQDYESLMVLTKQTNIKDIGTIKHTVKFIGDKNFLGFDQNQYLVTNPRFVVKDYLIKIKEFSPGSEYWKLNREKIYEVIKGDLIDVNNIIELSEIGRKLIEN